MNERGQGENPAAETPGSFEGAAPPGPQPLPPPRVELGIQPGESFMAAAMAGHHDDLMVAGKVLDQEPHPGAGSHIITGGEAVVDQERQRLAVAGKILADRQAYG